MQLRERRSVQSFGESQQDGQEQGQQSLMLRLAGQAARTLWLPSIICHLLRCPGASFLNLLVKISETHILKAAPSNVESVVSGIVGSKEFKIQVSLTSQYHALAECCHLSQRRLLCL